MQKNSLSLCMIVRDEEETVGRAIKSALAVVDEVVVVDTGSTDNTRLIVEGYGARVIDFPWCDDFSAARNAGLAAAYGDWILILDADEILESIRPVEMSRLLGREDAIAYYARIRNEIPGRPTTVYDKVRLFRNHPEIRYRYPIHEQITPSIAAVAARVGGEFLASGVGVVHYGSIDRDERGKKTRNQRLLHRAIDAYPDEPYFRYQLACEMATYLEERVLPMKGFTRMLGHLEQAVQLVETLPIEGVGHLGYGADLYARYANALLASGRGDRALDAAERGLDRWPDSTLLGFTHGMALLAVAEEDESRRAELRDCATERMEAMLEERESLEPAPISDAYFRLYPLRYLGEAALLAHDLHQAREHFHAALRLDPSYTGALCGLARLSDLEGKPKEALQIYLKALSLNEAEISAWLGGADVLVRLGFVDNATSWVQKLQILLPEHPRLSELLDRMRASCERVGAHG